MKDIVLNPRGSTPLLDAVGKSVSHLRDKVTDGAVVALVVTDGQENASREWKKDQVKSLIKELEGKKWTFTFLGANIDAFAEGGSIGMNAGTTLCFTNDSHGVAGAYAATSQNLYKGRGLMEGGDYGGLVKAMAYTEEQRKSAVSKTQAKV